MTTATDISFVEMRIGKVAGLNATDRQTFECVVVLDEVTGDRHLPILIGQPEALSLAAGLRGVEWPRPQVYEFATALVEALGGRVRRVLIDRIVSKAYGATVELDGPHGVGSVDARPSDALNLALRLHAPIFVGMEVLREADSRRAVDSTEADLLRRALTAPAVHIEFPDL